jgi:hypothetical protein
MHSPSVSAAEQPVSARDCQRGRDSHGVARRTHAQPSGPLSARRMLVVVPDVDEPFQAAPAHLGNLPRLQPGTPSAGPTPAMDVSPTSVHARFIAQGGTLLYSPTVD